MEANGTRRLARGLRCRLTSGRKNIFVDCDDRFPTKRL